jgi:hypothetical protein
VNYALHYYRLMDRARSRQVPSGYVERHHEMPRCLGGSDEKDNRVMLTAAEHYVSHLLLVRMHPGNPDLTWAAINMASGAGTSHPGRSANKLYAWLRREHAAARRGKKRAPFFTAEARAKMSAERRGKKLKPWTKEARARVSEERRGKKRGPQSPEHIALRVAAHLGAKRSLEARANMSAARKGKKFGPRSQNR